MSSRILLRLLALGTMLCVLGVIVPVGAASGSVPNRAAHASHRGPLSGDWSGQISSGTGYGAKREQISITINAHETAGTWKLSAHCYGRLTLDTISYGYHHYLRHVGTGASCAGGDIDCLKRAGAGLYDTVTSHLGGSWNTSGTLKRVRGSA